jgi:hypothetical protein
MSVRNQFKLLLGGLGARRRSGAPPRTPSAMREILDRSRLAAVEAT